VNIALVVSRCGMPLGYEIFAGNRADVTTLEEIVTTMEARYGKADRIWALDRGMISEDNIGFLKQEGRRYIAGTPKGMLKRFQRELLAADWKRVHEGLEVRLCPAPEGEEVFILCRSEQRSVKERAMHDRFEKRIEEALNKMVESCRKRRQKPLAIAQRVGKLLGRNTRAAGLAPEAGARGGPHSGLLSGLCDVENAGSNVPCGRTGRRTAKGPRRTLTSGAGGDRPTNSQGSDDSQALRQPAHRTPGNPAAAARTSIARHARNCGDVVKTRPHRRCKHNRLRFKLRKLG